ncbi:hypothetical protein JXA40_03270 [bacterium]|nr:hypothetical protein [candidate division CSSED10-310 bacterium]
MPENDAVPLIDPHVAAQDIDIEGSKAIEILGVAKQYSTHDKPPRLI